MKKVEYDCFVLSKKLEQEHKQGYMTGYFRLLRSRFPLDH